MSKGLSLNEIVAELKKHQFKDVTGREIERTEAFRQLEEWADNTLYYVANKYVFKAKIEMLETDNEIHLKSITDGHSGINSVSIVESNNKRIKKLNESLMKLEKERN